MTAAMLTADTKLYLNINVPHIEYNTHMHVLHQIYVYIHMYMHIRPHDPLLPCFEASVVKLPRNLMKCSAPRL